MANGCYVCVANRIGHELVAGPTASPVNDDGIEFWGQSFVAAPDGAVVTRASTNREEVLVVPCDLDRVEFAPHALAVPARPPDRRLRRRSAERFVDGTGRARGPRPR